MTRRSKGSTSKPSLNQKAKPKSGAPRRKRRTKTEIKRSKAAQRGWETRRSNSADKRAAHAPFPIAPPPRSATKHETLDQAWDRWETQCSAVVPDIVVNTRDWRAAGISPWGSEQVGAQLLMLYIGKEAREEAEEMDADGTLDAVKRYWADTGELPVEMVDSAITFEVRNIYRNPLRIQSSVFTADFIQVAALRADAGLTEAGKGHFELMWHQGEWLEIKRERNSKKRKKVKRK